MSDLTNAEKREILMEFYRWILVRAHSGMPTIDAVEREAIRRFPDPYEPKIVAEPDGWQWRIWKDGTVQYKSPDTDTWHDHKSFTPSVFMSFGEIAQEYSERTK